MESSFVGMLVDDAVDLTSNLVEERSVKALRGEKKEVYPRQACAIRRLAIGKGLGQEPEACVEGESSLRHWAVVCRLTF